MATLGARFAAPEGNPGTTAEHTTDGGDATVAYGSRALGSALRLFVRIEEPCGSAGRDAADRAWDHVRAEFEAVDRALSRFRADSELTALNRMSGTGSVARVSWRLREAIATMDRARRITGDRFDASVLDVLEQLGDHGAPLRLDVEEPAGTDDDRPLADLERPRPVGAPATALDTGGIGKGLALRWAAGRAMSALPPGAGLLIDTGGDIVVAGEPPDDGWLVGIEDPIAGRSDAPIAVAALRTGAIATSSVRVRIWRAPDGRPVHHLIDPATRAPARTGLLAVTVAGVDPAWAEVWTKSLFLAGRGAIADEARGRGLAAWWVDADGHLGMTPAARLQSAWVAEDRLG